MGLIIETERLLIRKFLISDASFILELVNTPYWLKFIGDRNVHTLLEAEQFIQNGPIQSYNQNGFGFYAVILKEFNIIIGMCGFAKRDYLDKPDIGFAFLPNYYSKGYGFEASNACLLYGDNTLKINEIFATVMPENKASIGLLKKLSFKFLRMVQSPSKETELMLFINQ